MNKELAYWMALAHLSGLSNRRKNELIAGFSQEEKTIVDFFHAGSRIWQEKYTLDAGELSLLKEALDEVPNYSFLAEDMLSQGYILAPIVSEGYSQVLKDNLKMAYAPPLLYMKGNIRILNEDSIAIVGSRNPSELSLEFTRNLAKKAGREYRVVVSGFARGVDKQALDSAISCRGQSIIVLPQGIMTFQSGFKKYYRQIVEGDVLVLGTFHPKVPWSVQLAMGRNIYIYGLAREIYVAESGDSGGTWSGVLDGLKKGRKIYVRQPEAGEKNANRLLIEKGAIAVDMDGNPLTAGYIRQKAEPQQVKEDEPGQSEQQVLSVLSGGLFSVSELMKEPGMTISRKKLTDLLNNHPEIEKLKNGKYTLKSRAGRQASLF